jgi:hypothetical protein
MKPIDITKLDRKSGGRRGTCSCVNGETRPGGESPTALSLCPNFQRIRFGLKCEQASAADTKKPEHKSRLPGNLIVSPSLESNHDLVAGLRCSGGNLLHPLHLPLLF